MNKAELVEKIAKDADVTKATAGRALDSFISTVKTQLNRGDSITLVGFGTFFTSKRAARSVRNPRTGNVMKVEEGRVPKFRPGKALKAASNP